MNDNNIKLFTNLPYDLREYIYKIATKVHFKLMAEINSTKYRILTKVLNNLGYKGLVYWSQFRDDEPPLRFTHIILNFTIINHIVRYKYLSKNNLKYELFINNILVNNRLTKQQLINMLLRLE